MHKDNKTTTKELWNQFVQAERELRRQEDTRLERINAIEDEVQRAHINYMEKRKALTKIMGMSPGPFTYPTDDFTQRVKQKIAEEETETKTMEP